MTQNASTKSRKAKMVAPENTLKKKVGHGGFDQATLAKAQNMIENNTVDFRPIAKDYISELNNILKEARAGAMRNEDVLPSLMFPLMQLKAQGGLFHYPFISRLSHVLIDCLETVPAADNDVLDLVEGYRDSINAAITIELKDEKHKIAVEFCDALSGACTRYDKMRAKRGNVTIN